MRSGTMYYKKGSNLYPVRPFSNKEKAKRLKQVLENRGERSEITKKDNLYFLVGEALKKRKKK